MKSTQISKIGDESKEETTARLDNY